MTTSSTETAGKPVEAAPAVETKDQPKVPIAAIAEQRAKTRAAHGEVERLQAELAKAQQELQAQSGKIDPNDVSGIVAQMMRETRERVETEMRETLGAEVEKYKFAAKAGLSEKQVDGVTALQHKIPGLSFDRALTLARTEMPDLFPAAQTPVPPAKPAWDRSVHGGLPVTGASEARSIQAVDYTNEMHKAAANKDWTKAQQFASAEFHERLWKSFPHMRPRNG